MPDILSDHLVLMKVTGLSAGEFYEQMGDKADIYLAYDLQRVLVHYYGESSSKRIALRAEVYIFESRLDAYGLASYLNKKTNSASLSLPTRDSARLTGEHIFYKDRYMVRLLPYASSEIGEVEIKTLASYAVKSMPGRSNPPEEVEILTRLGADREDIYYEPAIILGTKLLAPGLTAEIKWPSSEKVLVFIALKAEEEESQAAFQDYLMKKSRGVKGVSFTLGIGDVACTVWDEIYGWVNLAKSGRYIVGLAGAYNPTGGWPAVTRIISTLEEKDR